MIVEEVIAQFRADVGPFVAGVGRAEASLASLKGEAALTGTGLSTTEQGMVRTGEAAAGMAPRTQLATGAVTTLEQRIGTGSTARGLSAGLTKTEQGLTKTGLAAARDTPKIQGTSLAFTGLSSRLGSSAKSLEQVETNMTKTAGASYGLSRRLYGLQGITQALSGPSGFMGLSSGATVGLAVAGTAIAVFTDKAIHAYDDHEMALKQLQLAIGRSPQLVGAEASAFDKEAEAIQRSTGASRDSILAADTVLARFKMTADEIQQLNPLLADYAQATGEDLPAAAGNLGRALLGNTRALKAVGIEFHATGNTAKDTETIIADLQRKVGDTAAAFGQTLGGQIRIFTGDLHDLAIEGGRFLEPMFNALIHDAIVLLPVVEKLGVAMGVAFGGLAVKGAVAGLGGLLGGAAGGIGDLAGSVSALGAEGAAGGVLAVGTGLEAIGGALGTIAPFVGVAAALAAGVGLLVKHENDLHNTRVAEAFQQDLIPALNSGRISADQFARSLAHMDTVVVQSRTDARVGAYAHGVMSMSKSLWTAHLSASDFATIMSSEVVPALAKGQISQGEDNVLLQASAKFHYDLRGALVAYLDAQDRANEAMAIAADRATNMDRSLQVARDGLKRFAAGTGSDFTSLVSSISQAAATSANDGGAAFQTLVTDADSAWKKLRTGFASSLNFVSQDMSTLAGQSDLTAKAVVQAFDTDLKHMHTFASDFRKLVQEGMPKTLEDQFAQMGESALPIMDALTNGSKTYRDQAFKTYTDAGRYASDFAGTLTGQLVGSLKDLNDWLEKIYVQLGGTVPDSMGKTQAGAATTTGAIMDLAGALHGLPPNVATAVTLHDHASSGLNAIQQHIEWLQGPGSSTSVTLYEHTVRQQLKSTGGPVGYRTGGVIEPLTAQVGRYLAGYGGGDRIALRAEAGEFVIRKEAVRAVGLPFMQALNDEPARALEFAAMAASPMAASPMAASPMAASPVAAPPARLTVPAGTSEGPSRDDLERFGERIEVAMRRAADRTAGGERHFHFDGLEKLDSKEIVEEVIWRQRQGDL